MLPIEYIAVIVLGLLALFGRGRKQAGRTIPVLILLDEGNPFTPDASRPAGAVLKLSGRYPGLFARILKFLGLATICHLEVTHDAVKVTVARLSGVTYFYAPFQDITASDCRVEKPVRLLYFGLFLLVFLALTLLGSFTGLFIQPYSNYYYAPNIVENVWRFFTAQPSGFAVLAAVAALCIFIYWRTKLLVVAFSTSEISNRYGLAFRTGVIGGNNLTFLKLTEYIHYINSDIIAAHDSKPQ